MCSEEHYYSSIATCLIKWPRLTFRVFFSCKDPFHQGCISQADRRKMEGRKDRHKKKNKQTLNTGIKNNIFQNPLDVKMTL